MNLSNFDFRIQKAELDDLNALKTLIKKSKLVHEEIETHLENFFVIKEESNIIGCAGIEHYDDVGLLRSVAVDIKYQRKGLGKKLINKMIVFAEEKGIENLYLLTDSAEEFFKKFGFKLVSRNDVDSRIQQTYEYTTACDETASVMVKRLN